MSVATYHLPVDQFLKSVFEVTYLNPDKKTPIDLTGCQAYLQVRDLSGNLLVDLSTETSGINLGGASGVITITFTEEQTSDLSMLGAVYDLRINYPTGPSQYLMEGKILFYKRQTR